MITVVAHYIMVHLSADLHRMRYVSVHLSILISGFQEYSPAQCMAEISPYLRVLLKIVENVNGSSGKVYKTCEGDNELITCI